MLTLNEDLFEDINIDEAYFYNGKEYKNILEVENEGAADEFAKDNNITDFVFVIDTRGSYTTRDKYDSNNPRCYVLYNESLKEQYSQTDISHIRDVILSWCQNMSDDEIIEIVSKILADFKKESINEDVNNISVIEVPVKEEPSKEGPATPEARGLMDMLLTLINGENDTIQDYNSFIATLNQYPEYEDFTTVINDINAEEMNHVGMLQTLLKKLSPNAENIDAGNAEAEDILVDDKIEDDSFLSYYVPENLDEERLKEFDNWDQKDIDLYNSIDWKDRNYDEYEVADDEITSEVTAYGYDGPETKIVKMHKFIRPNAIYPPYYKAVEEPFDNVVGPMYDGNRHGKYDIHDRYETQELYDLLSR